MYGKAQIASRLKLIRWQPILGVGELVRLVNMSTVRMRAAKRWQPRERIQLKRQPSLLVGSRENGSLIRSLAGKTGVWRVPDILGGRSQCPMTPENKT